MKKYVHRSKYFYSNKVSDYGLENGYIDYMTLSKAFDCIMSNDIVIKTSKHYEWELYNGNDYDEENERYHKIYQWYIIDSRGADILQELTDEIVYYCEELDMYVWMVCHWGTSWDYVLTDIKIDLSGEEQ